MQECKSKSRWFQVAFCSGSLDADGEAGGVEAKERGLSGESIIPRISKSKSVIVGDRRAKLL